MEGESFEGKVVLVQISTRIFGVRRTIGKEIVRHLIESDHLKRLRRMRQQLRRKLEKLAVPGEFSITTGVWVIPIQLAIQARQDILAVVPQWEEARDAFLMEYTKKAREARKKYSLPANALPSLEDAARVFKFKYTIMGISKPIALAAVSETLARQECSRFDQRMSECLADTREIIRVECQEFVVGMIDRLTGKTPLQTAFLDNLRDFLSMFTLKDVAADTELVAIVQSVAEAMEGVDPKTLRRNKAKRQAVFAAFEKARESLGVLNIGGASLLTFENESTM
jgi:hypothetical protein